MILLTLSLQLSSIKHLSPSVSLYSCAVERCGITQHTHTVGITKEKRVQLLMEDREMIFHYYSNTVLSTLIVISDVSSSPVGFTLCLVSKLGLIVCLPRKWMSYSEYLNKHLRCVFFSSVG